MSHTHIFYILQLYSAGSLVADGKYVVPKGVAVEELKNYSGESILCIGMCFIAICLSIVCNVVFIYVLIIYFLSHLICTNKTTCTSYAQVTKI